MKTVGDFKKAGLVFVSLDKVDTAWNNRTPKSFAWRENTGVKPEFKGVVDVVTANKCEYERLSPDSAALQFEDDRFDCYVIKWRPSLNQPSVAESDTKESAIHKAWVALKGDFSNAKQYDENGSYLAVCIKDGFFIKEGGYCLTENLVENTEHWEDVCTVKEFTDYCEKMAAEEKRMKVIMQNGNDGLHYDNTAQQVEALAANHTLLKPIIFRTNEDAQQSLSEHFARLADNKPIFTQAMADNVDFKGGQKVYIAQINTLAGIAEKRYFVEQFWCGSGHQREYLSLGILFGSKEQAEHKCKSLLGIDTRTDREKAIDAAMKASGKAASGLCGFEDMFGKLYDAGYLKC